MISSTAQFLISMGAHLFIFFKYKININCSSMDESVLSITATIKHVGDKNNEYGTVHINII